MSSTNGQAVQRRKKVLFIAEAVTLAHVGRMLALAASLDPKRYQVLVAADPRYNNAIGVQSVAMRPIHTISSQRFFSALASGSPIYDAQTLIEYAQADQQLIEDYQADIVVGDFRLSLAASARLCNKPYINVTNAYWSPYAQLQYIVPEIPLTRALGPGIAQHLFNLARPIAFAQHAHPVNRMLKHFGYPTLARDLRYTYTEADSVCYADSPLLVPTSRLPAHHHFIGPVLWSVAQPDPEWWHSIPPDKPVIYINLGSSGQGELLPILLPALATLPVSVIVATAGRAQLPTQADNVYLTDFIAADKACQLASLVIGNGGSPSCYLALHHGKPSLSLPVNLDQYLNATLFTKAGVGSMLRSGTLKPRQFADTVQSMLDSASLQQTTTLLAQQLQQHNAATDFGAVLANYA